MSTNKLSILTILKLFKFDPDLTKDGTLKDGGCFLFYDWFCSDKVLQKKAIVLLKKLSQIALSKKIDIYNQYVFFKNNCPMMGPLYDDFRICDMSSGEVVFTITPKSGHTGKAEVHWKQNDFKEALVQGTWEDVVTFFNEI